MMQLELPTIDRVLSEPSVHEVGHFGHAASSNGSGLSGIRPEQALKAQSYMRM